MMGASPVAPVDKTLVEVVLSVLMAVLSAVMQALPVSLRQFLCHT